MQAVIFNGRSRQQADLLRTYSLVNLLPCQFGKLEWLSSHIVPRLLIHPSLFHCATCQAAYEVALREERDEQHRQRDDDAESRHRAPVCALVRNVTSDGDWQRHRV